jgi:hypothetical protein
MAKFISTAALALALAGFASQSASAGCDCHSGGAAVAQQGAVSSAPRSTAQIQGNRRYSYSPSAALNGASSGRSVYGNRAARASGYNSPMWRADRKVIGF